MRNLAFSGVKVNVFLFSSPSERNQLSDDWKHPEFFKAALITPHVI